MERDGTGTPRDGGTRLAPCIRASVLGIALTIGLPGAAVALDGATIAEQGNGQGAPGCSSCHGAGGEGQPSAGFPRLAGLDGGYLMKQLQEFASGKRANEIMGPIAKSLSDADMRALGAYYAGLATPKSQGEETADAAAVSAGAALAMHGDWSRDLPGCGQCHGPSGQGVGANFPALAGQSASYIVSQLAAWKAGTRANDPLDLMKSVAGKLDDDEVAAVAAYYASLPPAQSDASPTTETPR